MPLARDANRQYIQAVDFNRHSVVAIGAASTASAAFASDACVVRICADVDCWFTIGAAPVANTAGGAAFLPAGSVEYCAVQGGEKVAVVQHGSAGTLSVTEAA